MSNSSPLEPTPPDSKAPAAASSTPIASFAFNSGDDAALRQWEADQKQIQTSAASKDEDQITTTFSSDPSGTTSSSSFGAKPTVAAGDVPHMPVPASVPVQRDDKTDSDKLSSAPSHVAIELEKLQNDEDEEAMRQDIYLPAQDLLMTIRYLKKSWLNFTLFLIGSVLTAGILPLIIVFWVPRIYRQWIYYVREAPTEDELADCKAIPCLVKIPSEPASLQKLVPHKLPTPTPANKIFSPNFTIPYTSPADVAQEVPRPPLAGGPTANTTLLSHVFVLNFRHTPLIFHAPSQKLVSLPEWRDVGLESGAAPLTQSEVAFRHALFGPNIIDVRGQSLIKLTITETCHPFYVFTLASCGLWFYDTYQVYAAVVLAISILGIAATVIQSHRSQVRLQRTARYETQVEVMRVGLSATSASSSPKDEKASLASETWEKVSSEALVPGDIVSLSPLLSQSLPADMLLLPGASSCLVNESMLTGESVPCSKTPISPQALAEFARGERDLKGVEKSLVWGGTVLLRASAENSNDRVKAVVTSTAWNSSKGSLVKMMLFPKPVNFAFYKDAFLFILILIVIAVIGFIGSVINFVIVGVDGDEIGLRTIDLFTICVPPALPAAMSICSTFALRRLKQAKIFCVSPQRINLAGKVSIAVFDKTGTLTEGGLEVRGVRMRGENGKLDELRERMEDVNEVEREVKMEEAMAATHDVNLIDDEPLGDPLEVSMLLFTKWTMESAKRPLTGAQVSQGSTDPYVQCLRSPSGDATIAVLRKFDFVPSLRRMSVITQAASSSTSPATMYVKGAPESIMPLCDPATIPDDFDLILNEATRRGLRVLAFGYKTASLSWSGAQTCPREYVESDLSFLGLLFFENKLKSTTAAAIAELHEAEIPTKMCTGDSVNTAISVAREAGMIPPGQPVFVPRLPQGVKAHKSLGGMSNPAELVWSDVDLPQEGEGADEDGGLDPYSLAPRDPKLSLSTVGLALTGDVFQHLLSHASDETMARLLVRAQVFARFSPELKAELVDRLQRIDHTVAFCGDGANDTGALKGADLGLSLSEAEASVAAPFTSGADDIGSLPHLIKEGRNCLATSTSLFLYFALYALTEFYSVILLFGVTASLDNAQYLWIDIFQVFCIAIGMAWGRPAATLSKSRPFSRLMTRRIVLSLLGAIVLLIIAQTVPYVILHKQSWYEQPPFQPADLSLTNQDNSVVSKTAMFTFTIASIGWALGPPHREPLYRNYLLSFAILALAAINFGILFSNSESNGLFRLFGLVELPTSFLFIIFGTVLVQALLFFVWELWAVDVVCGWLAGPMRRFRSWRIRGDNVDVEKKFRRVERALKREEAQRVGV